MRTHIAPLIGASLALVTAVSGPATPASAAGPESGGCRRYHSVPTITLTEADNGQRLCVHRGQQLTVQLSVDPHQAPDPSQWWRPITEAGRALQAEPQIAIAVRGTTLGRYQAVQRGHAALSSTRSVCAAAPGAVCDAMLAWTVKITVR